MSPLPFRISISRRIPAISQKDTKKGFRSISEALDFGGESGIRTLDTLTGIHDFQSCALDHLGELSRSSIICYMF
jgi:hypothetical protein